MPNPNEPNPTVELAQDQKSSAVSGGDNTASMPANSKGSGDPVFGPPAAQGEVGSLGPYRVVKQLGRGGMGAVYLALDTRLNRKIALKVMLPEFAANAEARERFLREARAAALVAHDNVVTIFEADVRDGMPYITMQLLQGYPLDEYLKTRGTPGLHHALRIAKEAALGLAAAHKLGLVHRDIKPANLWLEAPNGRVKLLDFGLAKPVNNDAEMTRTGAVVGTPAFMSPEQAEGLKVDHRTDLFSLGAVLYRLCTGKLPFNGPNVMAVLMALANKEPTPVRELNPDVPEELAALIHRLLSKNPEGRPATAAEVAEQLENIFDQPVPLATPVEVETSLPVVLPLQSPVVSQMNISMQPEPSVFANLNTDDSTVLERSAEALPPEPRPKPTPKRGAPAGKGMALVAVAAVLLATVAIVGAISLLRKKDAPDTNVPTPDDSAKNKEVKPLPPVKPPNDGDRKAAEFVIYLGGNLKVEGDDRVIRAAAELPKGSLRLTHVTLRFQKQLTDESLAIFKDCKGLTKLDLTDAPITDAGLAHFKDCASLTDLHLTGTKVTNEGLAQLQNYKNLTYLELVRTGITDEGLKHVKNCKSLALLSLQSSPIKGPGLEHLKDCPNLTDLHLNLTPVTDAGLAHLKDCKNLTTLGLNSAPSITDACVPHLAKVDKLTTLFVKGSKVTAKSVEELGKAKPWCRIVWDSGTHEPTDPDRRAAEYIRSLNRGMTLEIDGKPRLVAPQTDLPGGPFRLLEVQLGPNMQLKDADIACLKGCKYLTNLSMYSTQVGDAGLAHLKDCENLTTLNLHKTRVTDAGLIHLANCTKLSVLLLEHVQVTDAGLIHLKNLKNLTRLTLLGTSVTDTGLVHLAGLDNLTSLDLTKTKVTAKGVEVLSTSLPKCKIVWDGTPMPK